MAHAKQTPKISRPRPGLGRGLGALIGQPAPAAPQPEAAPTATAAGPSAAAAPAQPDAAAADSGAGRHVVMVATHSIARCPWQPRQTFDEEALRELTDSIRSRGVIQPLICRRAADGACQLIAGERRLRAAIAAGLTEVPVLLMDAADRDAAEMAIIENIQREDLNIIEEAEGYRTLAERFGLTQQEVSERVGKARASVANAMRLLDLPDEVKQLLGSGQLSAGHAKLLLSLPDEKDQVLLARRTVLDGVTVRGLEKLVERRRTGGGERRVAQPDMPDSHLKDLTDRLHRHFGTRVHLVPGLTYANGKRAQGHLTVEFYDNDDLSRILGILGVTVD